LAQTLGYYDDSSIRLVEMTSASDVLHAMRSGSLDGAGLTLDEALVLMEEGADLKVIAVMDFSEGGDVLLAKPEIQSLADLKGKRVAVEYTAVGAIMLDSALEKAGLTVEEIDVVHCPHNQHFEMFDQVDAVVTFEPVVTQLQKKRAKTLFDSTEIPDRIIDVLVVYGHALESNPEGIRKLLAGYFRATKRLHDQPETCYPMIAPRLGLPATEVAEAYAGIRIPSLKENRQLLQGAPSPLTQNANELANFMAKRKLLSSPVALNDLTSTKFLPMDG
jgi:NitT/TauT family transport system substrate-binding protein